MATVQIPDPPKRLDIHILRSYSALRWWMCGLGFMLPLLLVGGGKISLWWLSQPLEIQNSLSAYYHAGDICLASNGYYRNLFVGILTAISLCLIIYRGFGTLESWLLNIAGISLAGVAFFPMGWPEQQVLLDCQKVLGFKEFLASKLLGLPIAIHFASAAVFFLMLILVNWCTAMDTVDIIKDDKSRKRWRKIFSYARWLMPVSLGLVGLLCFVTKTERIVLWLEWAGIWAFSIYWLLKSIEILSTKVDVEMINGDVKWAPPAPADKHISGEFRHYRHKRHLVRVDKSQDKPQGQGL